MKSQQPNLTQIVAMRNSRKLYIGSFHRPPDNGAEPVEELNTALNMTTWTANNYNNAIIILGGNSNAPDIIWENGKTLGITQGKSSFTDAMGAYPW